MNPQVILGLLGSAITLALLFELLRRRRLREKYAVIWIVVAIATIIFGLFPGVLTSLADLVGVEVPANLLFFLASMTLMVISLQHSQELGRMEERTRILAEEVALLRADIDAIQLPRAGGDQAAGPAG